MSGWISWEDHPVPDDVKGIIILYEDGAYPERRDHETGKRKYRDSKIVAWNFIPRSDPTRKTVQCIICRSLTQNPSDQETCEDCHYEIVKRIHSQAGTL